MEVFQRFSCGSNVLPRKSCKESKIYSQTTHEWDGMNPSQDGIDLLHDLFPEIRFSEPSQSNVYKKNENFSE